MNEYILLFLVSLSIYNNQVIASSQLKKSTEQSKVLAEWFWGALGNIEVIKKLLHKVDINAQDNEGYTALMTAAMYGKDDIVELLLTVPGIDLNVQNNEKETALMVAASHSESVVNRLLQVPSININAQDHEGETALMKAIMVGNEYVVKLFLQIPTLNINAQDKWGTTALMKAYNRPNIFKLLLRVSGININLQDNDGQTALTKAALCGYRETVEILLKEPTISVNIKAENGFTELNGFTALMYAVTGSDQTIVKLLLAAPTIDINTTNKNGKTALMEAVSRDALNIVKLLLQVLGINITAKDRLGNTAYDLSHNFSIKTLIQEKIGELVNIALCAIQESNIPVLKSVISQIGFDYIVGESGNTLLHKAFASNSADSIIFLLHHAPDTRELVCQKNKAGKIPLELIDPTSDIFRYLVELPFKCEDSLKSASIKFCQKCKTNSAFLFCSKCKKAYYCTPQCQKSDWHMHKHNCKN